MWRRARTIFGLSVAALLMTDGALAQDKIRVGFGSLASSHMVLLVARDFGLFRKHNLEAEIVGNIPGAKAVVPLVSGDAQVIHAAGPPFVLGALGGSDVVIFMGLINTMSFYLVAHKDITNPLQLQGQKDGRKHPRLVIGLCPALRAQQTGAPCGKRCHDLGVGR